MNPLDRYPAIRAALYLVQWIANGVLSVAGVVFLTIGTAAEDLPLWYILSVAIGPVLWTYLGVTAQANTPSAKDVADGIAAPPDQRGQINAGVSGLIAILLAVALGLWILSMLGVNVRVG